jgi:hypothetical protein
LIPIRSSSKIATNVFLIIFSNIEILVGLHKELLADIENGLKDFESFNIAELFMKFIPSMSIYTQYVNNFSSSLAALEAEKQKTKAFAQFLDQCSETHPLPLDALLSFPLNRIPYYRAVVTEVLNLTPRNRPDYKTMVNVVGQLTELQEYLNQSKSQSDNLSKIFKVETRIQGREASLRDLNRVFIKEGPIILVNPKDRKQKEVYLFLFNDILVGTTKLKEKSGQFRYKFTYQLQYGRVISPQGSLQIDIHNPSTGESKTFLAQNTAHKEEWTSAFSGVIDAMEKTRVYGVTLEQLMVHEADKDIGIPSYIHQLLTALDCNDAFEASGLFRISASSNLLNALIDKANRGIKFDLSELDHYVISCLLKQFFRSLKEPVIPFQFYDQLVACNQHEDPVPSLREVIFKLPDVNRELLKRLMQLLVKVAAKCDVNKMTTANLGIVIGPNLARESPETDPIAEIALSATLGPLVEKMLIHYDEIFPKDPPPKFARALPKSALVSRSHSTSHVISMDGAFMGVGRFGSRIGSPQPVHPGSTQPGPSQANQPTKRAAPPPPPRRLTQSSNVDLIPKPEILPETSTGPSPVASPDQSPANSSDAIQLPAEVLDSPQSSDSNVPSSPEGTLQVESENSQETSGTEVAEEANEGSASTEPICARCELKLGEEFIEACSKLWHPDCFVCNVCSSGLSGGFFKTPTGFPICRSCKRNQRKGAQ